MKVYLMGEIGEKFGSEWNMKASRVKNIFNLIGCQRKGFREYMFNQVENGVNYTIQRGEDFLGEEELELSLGDKDIIITPVPAGAGAVGKIVIGAILLVTVGWALISFAGVAGTAGATTALGSSLGSALTSGFAASLGGAGAGLSGLGMAVAGLGLSLVMSGIQEMLMPEPSKDRVEQDSYLFGGGVNGIREGLPVPIIYGELEVSGKPISVNYTVTKPVQLGWTYVQPYSGATGSD
jgi:predicted phage tail protein